METSSQYRIERERLAELVSKYTEIPEEKVLAFLKENPATELLATRYSFCETEEQREKLELLFEFKNLYKIVRGAERDRKYQIRGLSEAKDYFKPLFADIGDREHFKVAFCDAKMQIVSTKTMSQGSLDWTSVPMREVVKEAIFLNTPNVIAAHNHPSGITEPSSQDEEITKMLWEALNAVNVRFCDHLIVGRNEIESLYDLGYMPVDISRFSGGPQEDEELVHPESTGQNPTRNQHIADNERLSTLVSKLTGIPEKSTGKFLEENPARMLYAERYSLCETETQREMLTMLIEFRNLYESIKRTDRVRQYPLTGSGELKGFVGPLFADTGEQACIKAIFCDAKLQVISTKTMEFESMAAVSANAQQFAEEALVRNATDIFTAHHPAHGNPKATLTADAKAVNEMRRKLEPLNVRYLDHCIVGKYETVSLRGLGQIDIGSSHADNTVEETFTPYKANPLGTAISPEELMSEPEETNLLDKMHVPDEAMEKFREITSRHHKKRLFVDMDGVLAVFTPVDTLETLYEKGYYQNLQPNQTVINAVKQYISENPDVDVHVLSSVLPDSKYALEEKNAWLDAYLPEIAKENRIFPPCGMDKRQYLQKEKGMMLTVNDVLLDDYTKNLQGWEPPARGLKLLNGINHTNGSWDGSMISVTRSAAQLCFAIDSVMDGSKMQDRKPQDQAEVISNGGVVFQPKPERTCGRKTVEQEGKYELEW